MYYEERDYREFFSLNSIVEYCGMLCVVTELWDWGMRVWSVEGFDMEFRGDSDIFTCYLLLR